MRQTGSSEVMEMFSDRRQQLERLVKTVQVARIGTFERDLTEQPLEILNSTQHAAQFFACNGVCRQCAYRLPSRFNLRSIETWPENPGLQVTRAGGCDTVVQHGKQRRGTVPVEDGFKQFQVPQRRGVEH